MTLDELARVCRYMKIAYFDYDTSKRLGVFDCHEVHYRNMGLKKFLVICVYFRGPNWRNCKGGRRMKLREYVFTPQEIDCEPPITVDGVETAARLGVWAKELYGDCDVVYVSTNGIHVMNKDKNVRILVTQCNGLFRDRREFMKKTS